METKQIALKDKYSYTFTVSAIKSGFTDAAIRIQFQVRNAGSIVQAGTAVTWRL